MTNSTQNENHDNKKQAALPENLRTPRISDFIEENAQEWDDDKVLVRLGEDAVFTQRHATAGVLVLGQTGSGKTSGPGKTLAQNYLAAGYGFLVLCVKSEEAGDWVRYANEAGRGKDVIRITPNGPYKWDFLLYEMSQIGHSTLSLVTMIRESTAILRQAGGRGSNDEFWESSSNDLLKNTIDLLKFSHVYAPQLQEIGLLPKNTWVPSYRPCILSILELIRTAPSQQSEFASKSAATSFCMQCINLASHVAGIYADALQNGTLAKIYGNDKEMDIHKEWELRVKTWNLVLSYWQNEWASKGPGDRKMQDSVRAFAKSTIEALERGEVANIFQREEVVQEDGRKTYRDTITPDALGEGKILIIDVPVLEWRQSGQLANCIWKYGAQRFIERRGKARDEKIERCEAQFIPAIRHAEQEVYRLEDAPRLTKLFSDWRSKKKAVDANMNRLKDEYAKAVKKIKNTVRPIVIWADECHNFHVSRDVDYQTTARSNRGITVLLTQNIATLDGAAGGGGGAHALRDALAGNLTTRIFCKNQHADTNQWAEKMIGHDVRAMKSTGESRGNLITTIIPSVSGGKSYSYQPIVPAVEFTLLRIGGPLNNFSVDAIIIGAEPFSPRKTWLKCVFNQNIKIGRHSSQASVVLWFGKEQR